MATRGVGGKPLLEHSIPFRPSARRKVMEGSDVSEVNVVLMAYPTRLLHRASVVPSSDHCGNTAIYWGILIGMAGKMCMGGSALDTQRIEAAERPRGHGKSSPTGKLS